MPLVVQKYGGSSVADAERIKRVAERVVEARRAGNEVVVVVSAMGDTTDELIALAHQVAPLPGGREKFRQSILLRRFRRRSQHGRQMRVVFVTDLWRFLYSALRLKPCGRDVLPFGRIFDRRDRIGSGRLR